MQYGDMLSFSYVVFFFTLEYVAAVFIRWVEFFLSMKLQNNYVDQKISAESESTKWLVNSKQMIYPIWVNYPFNRLQIVPYTRPIIPDHEKNSKSSLLTSIIGTM